MESIVVVELGVEGGGATVSGSKLGETWSFWQEGTSIWLDEDDGESWQPWTSDPVPDLLQALPEKWWLMYPISIHSDFLSWFREQYDIQCRTTAEGEQPMQKNSVLRRWKAMLRG